MPNTPLADALSVTMPNPISIYTENTTSRTTSGNTTTITPPIGYTRAFVGINVTAISGSGATQTFSFQQQDANGNWCPIALTSPLAVTATGQYSFSIGQGQTNAGCIVGPIRIAWTASGTVTTCSFQIGVTVR